MRSAWALLPATSVDCPIAGWPTYSNTDAMVGTTVRYDRRRTGVKMTDGSSPPGGDGNGPHSRTVRVGDQGMAGLYLTAHQSATLWRPRHRCACFQQLQIKGVPSSPISPQKPITLLPFSQHKNETAPWPPNVKIPRRRRPAPPLRDRRGLPRP